MCHLRVWILPHALSVPRVSDTHLLAPERHGWTWMWVCLCVGVIHSEWINAMNVFVPTWKDLCVCRSTDGWTLRYGFDLACGWTKEQPVLIASNHWPPPAQLNQHHATQNGEYRPHISVYNINNSKIHLYNSHHHVVVQLRRKHMFHAADGAKISIAHGSVLSYTQYIVTRAHSQPPLPPPYQTDFRISKPTAFQF